MDRAFVDIVRDSAASLWSAMQLLLVSAVGFALFALLVKGREAIAAAERARKEVSINLWLYVLDALFVGPLVAVVVQLLHVTIGGSSLEIFKPSIWASVPVWVTLLTAVFCGDFISYFRHRLEHTRTLWPSHAIHHSDTEMTWFTLSRFHPINRLSTIIVDTAGLAVMGLPEWALLTNALVRHYYGEFIHADLPWMYGPFGRVFVSPVMHRWHHARDVTGAGSNFATVFSVFDQAFGTYYVPGPCNVPLGVNDKIGNGTLGQLVYPIVEWRDRIASRLRRARAAES